MDNTPTTSNIVGAGYVPPTMWKDLSVEEKLERTREQFRALQNQVSNFYSRLDNIENDIKNHDHLDGRVVKDIKTLRNNVSGLGMLVPDVAAYKNGEVYF